MQSDDGSFYVDHTRTRESNYHSPASYALSAEAMGGPSEVELVQERGWGCSVQLQRRARSRRVHTEGALLMSMLQMAG